MQTHSSNAVLAFVLARLAIGLSMFGHGIIRIPKLTAFSEGMVEQFAGSPLPQFLVLPFSYVLPFLELTTGLLLLLGWRTREGLLLGAAVMLALIFGTGMIENWGSLPSQLIHAAYFAVLLVFVDRYNGYSVDTGFSRRAE